MEEQKLVDELQFMNKNNNNKLTDSKTWSCKQCTYINNFKLTPYEANVLVSEIEISKYFEDVIKDSDIKLAKNWIIVELFAVLNEKNIEIKDSPVTPKNLAILINQISSGNISGKIAKEVFDIMVKTSSSADKIIEDKGLKQQSNPEEIKKIIKKVLDKNSEKVSEYKSGKVNIKGSC